MASHLHREFASALGIPEEQVRCDSRLVLDLGLDACDCLELLDALEARLGVSIPDEVLASAVTVGDLEGRIAAVRDAEASVDVSEGEGHYVITAWIPGAGRDDVAVELQDDLLTIRGEKRDAREEQDERRRYVERSYGAFSRSFTLPANADPDRIEASFADGVLRLRIGKREEAKARSIVVG